MRPIATVIVCLFVFESCQCGRTTPTLTLTLTPTTVVGPDPVKVVVSAEFADGRPGTGNVQVQSSSGSLSTPVTLPLDGGTAETTLTVDPIQDQCSTPVTVTGSWTPSETVTADAGLTVLSPVYDAGAPTPNALSPIDALCDTDAGQMTVFPDAGPLLPNDVPADCANGFELNNPDGGTRYTLLAKTSMGSRELTLDVDLATYRVPDRVRITGVDGCSNDYLLMSTCELKTGTTADPSGGAGRPPDDTIRQFRLNMPGHTKSLTFDFSGVTSPVYLRVLGLCDFDIVPFANGSHWQAVP